MLLFYPDLLALSWGWEFAVRMNSASSMVMKNGAVRKKTFYMMRKEEQKN